MIDTTVLDPLGFAADELAARGALLERDGDRALAVLPGPLARQLALPEAITLATTPGDDRIPCGLGAPLLDRLIADVRASVPVASVAWQAEPPKAGAAERMAGRVTVRNGVADVLGAAHASATYLAGVLAWIAEADDRYEGMAFVVAHGATGAEPDPEVTAALGLVISADDARAIGARDAAGATGAAAIVARRSALAIGPRLDEVGAAVARRRDREVSRIDDYFHSLIAEARRPRARSRAMRSPPALRRCTPSTWPGGATFAPATPCASGSSRSRSSPSPSASPRSASACAAARASASSRCTSRPALALPTPWRASPAHPPRARRCSATTPSTSCARPARRTRPAARAARRVAPASRGRPPDPATVVPPNDENDA
jgi:hypothetical protein